MRSVIEGKHLGGMTTVDMRTGKETKSDCKMFMMPAREGTCEMCAVDHVPEQPHNAQSLHYQYRFFNENGRWPNWIDAMSHCSMDAKKIWKQELENQGVRVDEGQVTPGRKKK